MRYNLDELDRKIINLLQENARMKNSEIAQKLGKPTSTIYERVKKLEKAGVIKGYRAVVDPRKVGYEIVGFILGEPRYTEDLDWEEVGRKLAKIPGVQEVYFLTGQDDYLLKLRAKDSDDYSRITQEAAKILSKNARGMLCPKVLLEESKIEL